MKSVSFRKDLVGVQDELLRFAYKLTTDREEAMSSMKTGQAKKNARLLATKTRGHGSATI